MAALLFFDSFIPKEIPDDVKRKQFALLHVLHVHVHIYVVMVQRTIVNSDHTVVSRVSAHGCLNITRDFCLHRRLPGIKIPYEAATLTP